MIINFSVENFQCINEKVQLSFEATNSNELSDYYIIDETVPKYRLLKLGLIYGANASGKTTILKALDFLRDIVVHPFEKKTDIFEFQPFLFDERTQKKNTFFVLEFLQKNIKYLLEVELNENAIINEALYSFNPKKALVYKRKTDTDKQLTLITFGKKTDLGKEQKNALESNTLWNNTVLGGFLKTNIESHELQEVINWFRKKLYPLIEPKTNLFSFISQKIENGNVNKNNIIELLKKADFNISDIIIEKKEEEIPSELLKLLINSMPDSVKELSKDKELKKVETININFLHKFNQNEKYLLPYESESAGTKRYYQFSGLLDLMIRNETIFSIDEIESSLHPDLMKYFLLTFLVNSKKSQLITTTHHRELLLEKDILREDVIWFTDKSQSGDTELYSLSDFDSSTIRNTSSIYNAYKIGKLGAKPHLGDYYIDLEDGKE